MPKWRRLQLPDMEYVRVAWCGAVSGGCSLWRYTHQLGMVRIQLFCERHTGRTGEVVSAKVNSHYNGGGPLSRRIDTLLRTRHISRLRRWGGGGWCSISNPENSRRHVGLYVSAPRSLGCRWNRAPRLTPSDLQVIDAQSVPPVLCMRETRRACIGTVRSN